MTDLLTINNLAIGFGKGDSAFKAVDGVSLSLAAKETIGLVGESGSGKSLTARAILGLTPPGAQRLSGEIVFRPKVGTPKEITALKPHGSAIRAIRGNQIAMIFQEPMASLSPVHTIGTQIATTLREHTDLGSRAVADRVIELLDQVRLPHPKALARQYPHELSGGMRQRAMIAMALSCNPVLLICDEPTTALDATTEAKIVELLQDLKERHDMAMLFLSHNIGLVANVSDRVLVMQQGRIVEEGRAARVLTAPQHPYTKMLLAAAPRLTTAPSERGQRVRPQPTEPLVTLTGVSKVFAGRGGLFKKRSLTQAVTDVSFTLHQGETLALVGESGSGKTTTARMIMAAHPPTSGRIELRRPDKSFVSIPALRGAARKTIWRDVQMVFQDPYTSLNPRMTVGQILAEPLRNFGLAADGRIDERITEMLTKVGLDPAARHRFPHAFSGGQRQRIGIARALIVEPKLVIADEPVAALDVAIAAQVMSLFNELKRALGLTYLLITHDLSLVQKNADRVAVMQQGRLVELGATHEIFAAPQHAYTKELLAAVPRLPELNVA